MVKTSAQPYKHIIHTHTIIYNEQPVTQDSDNNNVWHREVGSQKQTAPNVANSPIRFIDLDMKLYLHSENELLGHGFQKLVPYRQTDAQTDASGRIPCRIREC